MFTHKFVYDRAPVTVLAINLYVSTKDCGHVNGHSDR
jgi:hypothetical protein